MKWGTETLQGDGGIAPGRIRRLSILLHRQDLLAGLLKFVVILNGLFLGALFCRVLALIFVQKSLIYCKSIIWDIGYTQGNVDAKKLELVHVRKVLCAISSDLVKSAP